MVKLYKKHIVAIAILLMASYMGKTQNSLDSLLEERATKSTEYYQFKHQMNERTWLNLVELGNKASDLIETDNFIFKQYLQEEVSHNKQLQDDIEKLNLEIALLKREAEIRESQLTETSNYSNTLFLVLAGAGILILTLLIILINRQIRYRSVKTEIERLWAFKEDPQYNPLQRDELKLLTDQVNKLADENSRLKNEMSQIKGQKSEAMEALKKEIRSRREVEKEIKDLISQIKKK